MISSTSILVLFCVAGLAAFFGDWVVYKISASWREKINSEDFYLTKADRATQSGLAGVARQVGMAERALYVIALYAVKPEFIAVWLAFKVAIEWRAWNPEIMYGDTKEEHRHYLIVQRARFNNFVLGNALSLLATFIIVALSCLFLSCVLKMPPLFQLSF